MTNSNEQTMATMVVGHGSTITTTTGITPKQVKGGVFATADLELIKKALSHYARLDISDSEQRQIANLMHRLNSRV